MSVPAFRNPEPDLSFFLSILRGEAPRVDSRELDWKRTTWLAHHHGLASRTFRILSSGPLAVPPVARESLLQGHLRAQKMHLLAEAFLPGWIEGLRARGVPVALLKGWGLAHRFYDHPADRDFCDFDLLFPAARRGDVLRFFGERAFGEQAGTAHWKANAGKVELVWARNPEVVVECHFGLGYGPFEFEGLWERIPLSYLEREDEFLYLVYHAGVQHRFQKLFWLMDLVELSARYPELLKKEGDLPDRAGRHGLGPALDLARDLITRVNRFGAGLAPSGALGSSRPGEEGGAFSGPGGKILARVMLARYEDSFWARAALRARLQGGWGPLAGYGIRRTLAQARLRC